MTREEAQAILDIAEAERLRNATAGRIASDAVAEAFNVSRGEGLSLVTRARDLIEGREEFKCPTCGKS